VTVRVGVSRCLLGDRVRYDGEHHRDERIIELGERFEWVPICPEVEIGLPVPRPTIRLVRIGDAIRVQGSRDPSMDVTDALGGLFGADPDRFADVCGFVLKGRSPSCGVRRTKIYDAQGQHVDEGPGAFTRAVMQQRPHLPIIDEERLGDPAQREDFVARVLAVHRAGRD
jgi:uncharacterized protein YbbK (DUF523 family)